MAARAKVRFSSSGAGSITGAFSKVGSSASGAHSKVGKFGSGIGSIFYKVMRNIGRMTMFSAGMQQMGKSATGAEHNMKGFASGAVTSLSAVSKKFAELRRQYYFFKFTGQKLAAPLKWMAGPTKKEEPPKAAPSRFVDRVKAADPSSNEVKKATSAWQKFLAVLGGGDSTFSRIAKKVLNLKNIITVLVASFTAISVAGGVAFVAIGYQTAKFAKRIVVDFMSIREAFRQYEVSLGGIIKNTYALGKMMNFATKYAAEYPAMFEEVLDTFRSLAALPALKPMFQKADEQDLKRLMDIIQGLATLDPLQGVRGAGIALREALSGDMRSVRRRFEIPAKAIAEAGGYALEEITQDSQKALKAFHAFIKLNVPAKSMADAAMNISIQVGNLRDKYRTFVNDMMKSTGAYWEVVTALSSVNEWLNRVFASQAIKNWAVSIGSSIRAVVATLKASMSDIDWGVYIDSGNLVGGLVEAAVKIAVFLRAMSEKFSAPFLDAVSKISRILWSGLIPIIGTLMKAILGIFWEGMKAAGKASMESFYSGLASGAIFKSIASFMYDAMATIGKVAGTAFMAAFVGSLNIVGAVSGKLSETMERMADESEAKWGKDDTGTKFRRFWAGVLKTTADYWKGAPDLGEALSIDGDQISADATKSKKSLEELKASIMAMYDLEKVKISPEVVTPETPVKQQEWRVQDLKAQLAASNKLGASMERRKALAYALAEAEKALTRARALKKWEAEYAGDRETALSQMKEYEAAVTKARKAGKDLGVGFYIKKGGLQGVLDNFDELYGKIVDQKDAFKDLQAGVKTALGSMEEWSEQYKIGKKDAGALLIVVKKLQDIISMKVKFSGSVFLDLLKKRIQLTDKVIEKEKEYRKQIISTAKEVANVFGQAASGLQSSILSFADTLKDAFLGVPSTVKGYEPQRMRIEEPGAPPRTHAGREKAFSKQVMDKIGQMMMVPADMFGLGRGGMTYEEGYKTGAVQRPGDVQKVEVIRGGDLTVKDWTQGKFAEGGQAPAYLAFMLDGIRNAIAAGQAGKGIGKFPEGLKLLSEMRMALLEKALPFTAPGSEERADIYAKMAGVQADIMRTTMAAALADAQVQKRQLAAVESSAESARIALEKADAVIQAIVSLKASGTGGTGGTGGTAPSTGANPANPSTDMY